MTKRICRTILVVFFLLAGADAYAAGYTPLVHIPGLPENSNVDISQYLVGLYNFLLSIVGIAAVVMLIIGGMQYITAVGSGGAVSGAKATIKDALVGLMLALMSWLIVYTINPDVLYLRQPGYALKQSDVLLDNPMNRCYKRDVFDNGGGCECNDGYKPTGAIQSGRQCQAACKQLGNHCAVLDPNYCIEPGSAKGVNDNLYPSQKCSCVTGDKHFEIPQGTVPETCQQACLEKNMCGYKFLGISLKAPHGYIQDDTTRTYRLSATDRGSGRDELFAMTLTNNFSWNGFLISNDPDNPNNPQATDDNGNVFPCSILITNIANGFWLWSEDIRGVLWVREGVTVGQGDRMIDDLSDNYLYGCRQAGTGANNLFGVTGSCGTTSGDGGVSFEIERILRAAYTDDIYDSCGDCEIADGNQGRKGYVFKRTYTCRGGFWQ